MNSGIESRTSEQGKSKLSLRNDSTRSLTFAGKCEMFPIWGYNWLSSKYVKLGSHKPTLPQYAKSRLAYWQTVDLLFRLLLWFASTNLQIHWKSISSIFLMPQSDSASRNMEHLIFVLSNVLSVYWFLHSLRYRSRAALIEAGTFSYAGLFWYSRRSEMLPVDAISSSWKTYCSQKTHLLLGYLVFITENHASRTASLNCCPVVCRYSPRAT